MNQKPNLYSRLCWYDPGGTFAYSRWYRGTAATEQAKAACEMRWPHTKFWIEKAYDASMPELTIQDLIG